MSADNLKLEKQICHSLYSASNALVRAYKPLLAVLDLTYPQYIVMMALWDRDHVMIKDLVQRTRFDAGTLTPILKRLSAKGLVDITASERDARQKEVVLLTKGRSLKNEARSVPDALICQADLTMDDAIALKMLCEKLYQSFAEK